MWREFIACILLELTSDLGFTVEGLGFLLGDIWAVNSSSDILCKGQLPAGREIC